MVYVGTEHGVLFAFSTAGQILWFRGLGSQVRTDCLDQPDGIFGITSAPVFDRATNRLYVADSAGQIHALDPATGATVAGWPINFTTSPSDRVRVIRPHAVRQQPVHRGGLAL